ncbi:MAG: glycosyltransferase family 4 protein [Dethiobacteria bacterium]
MKIGIFTDSFKPYVSGVVRSIETFHQEFTALGHEVYIFGPSYLGCEREDHVFRFIGIPAPTKPDFMLPIPFSLQLRSKIKELDIDLIHVHSPFLLGRLGARVAKRFRLPLVFTFHTFYEQYVHYVPFPQSFSKKVVQAIARDFCNRCNLVITPSYPVKQYLHKIGVRSPVKIIPTGIDLTNFSKKRTPYLRRNFPIADSDRILLFVGRLGKEKNVFFLLKVLKYLQQFKQNIKLVFVGAGPQEELLKSQAFAYGLSEDVFFTGNLKYEDVVNCYFEADVFTFPSQSETQGLVIGEAKAAGLPVVAIRALGVAEMVKDGEDGILTSNSVKEFSEAVLRLLSDHELYRKMQDKLRQNAEEISSRACALQLLASYEELLQKKQMKASI